MRPSRSGQRAKVALPFVLLVVAASMLIACPSAPNGNHAPVAEDATVTTSVDTPVEVTLVAHDADGDALTFTIQDDPMSGSLTGAGDVRTYTPTAGFTGTDTFTFHAHDGVADSNLATVTIQVGVGNHPPVADTQGVPTAEDTPVQITLTGSDPDGDPLTFDVIAGPEHGTLTGTPPTLTYTPDPGFTGMDEFHFTVSDGHLVSDPASVTIDVGNTNDPPSGLLLRPDPVSIPEGTPVGADVGTFETIDPDLPLDTHTYTLVPGVGDDDNGDYAISGDTLVTAAVFDHETRPSTTIRVRTTDALGEYLEAVFTIAISDVNEPPVITPIPNQTILIGDDLAVPITVQDETPDSVNLTASSSDSFIVTDSDLTLTGSGADRTLHITPTPCHAGTTTLTTTATDPHGLHDSETFDLHIQKPFQSTRTVLMASDGGSEDWFGHSVAIDGDHAIIGAPRDTWNGVTSGTAYAYAYDGGGWSQVDHLAISDATDWDWFGDSVAIDGDYAIVGAHGVDAGRANTDEGAAYIFYRSGETWTEVAALTAKIAVADDRFGYSVAIDGDQAIVGAPSHDVGLGGDGAGAAYVFQGGRAGWTQVAKLTADIPHQYDHFGRSVDIEGEYAIVGAVDTNVLAQKVGAAYVFHRSDTTWTQVSTLQPDDGAALDWFGTAVAIDGDVAVVGAPNHDHGPTHGDEGATYLFRRGRSGWTQLQKLTASDAGEDYSFGNAVSIHGESVIIGSYSASKVLSGAPGTAYVFQACGDTWKETARLSPGPSAFGVSVSLHGDRVLVGECLDCMTPMVEGAAYVFER